MPSRTPRSSFHSVFSFHIFQYEQMFLRSGVLFLSTYPAAKVTQKIRPISRGRNRRISSSTGRYCVSTLLSFWTAFVSTASQPQALLPVQKGASSGTPSQLVGNDYVLPCVLSSIRRQGRSFRAWTLPTSTLSLSISVLPSISPACRDRSASAASCRVPYPYNLLVLVVLKEAQLLSVEVRMLDIRGKRYS